MLTVYNCLVTQHDLRLVALAAVICTLASFAGISLLHHVRCSAGRMRLVWLAVSATATGFGIWATHFIAMLAFAPGLPNAYDVPLTFLSLVIAAAVTGVGLAVAASSDRVRDGALGGAIVGGGIAAMHFTGMAAFEVQGQIVWDPALVIASIVLGALIAGLAVPIGLRSDALRWKAIGALSLTLAICAMHFTAMGAVSILPDAEIVLSQSSLPASWLAGSAALASIFIISLALAGAAFDVFLRQRERQTEQLLGLANAAVEGMVVCEDDVIVAVNDSFSRLVGSPCASLAGSPLNRCLPDEVTRLKLLECPGQLVEGEVLDRDGTRVPVELIQHRVNFVDKQHRAIAVRDLRARKEAEQHIRHLAHQAEAEEKAAKERTKAERRAAMLKLADEFETMVGNIIETVSQGSNQLEEAANLLSTTANTAQERSRLVASASDEASSNVRSVAAATEEIASSIQEVSRRVHESNKIAGEAVKQAEDTNTQVMELSDAAGRIGNVVKLIADIAARTNLLALNATIEAARAGSAGKGFAVVAQEVKALAAQTAQATHEIDAQIGSIQRVTQESVKAIKGITDTIAWISDLSSTVAAAMEEQGTATREIAQQTEQAARGTAEVATNITAVSGAVTETGSSSVRVLTSARSLVKESDRLKREVRKYVSMVRNY